MRLKPSGIIPPIITPFSKDQEINEDGFRAQVNFLIENGVHGIFTGGTSGEFFTLSSKERKKVSEIAIDEINGRVTTCVGTGSSSTKETIELTNHAKDIGADIAVVIAPYITHTTEEGIYRHYEIVAKAVDIPIMIYNIPERSGLNLDPPTVMRISEIENIVGIKDSSNNMVQFGELLDLIGDRITIFQGEDPLIFESLVLGGHGCVPAVANVVPNLVVDLYNDVVNNMIDEARRKQMLINRIMRELLGYLPWPAGIKETLNLMGKRGGIVRLPLVMVNEDSRKQIKENFEKLKELNIF